MVESKIGWGIIGCGDVCESKSGPGFQKAQGSTLVAVMRRDKEKAADFARRHGVPRWYASAQELLSDGEVDAVYVATPPSTHLEFARLALAAKKPVYIEKPMALNEGECWKMLQAARSVQLPLFVAYYRRALPRFLKVKQLVESGAIGEPRFVEISLYRPPSPEDRSPDPPWRVQPHLSGGGHFFDLACHTLDFLDFVLGEIEEAVGHVSNQGGLYEAEDSVTASFRFKSGVHGVGLWCFAAGTSKDWTELVGTNGKVGFASFEEAPVRLTRGSRSQEFEIPHPLHVQQPLIQMAVDELLGRGTCPSSGESALRTSRVMDWIVGRDRR